MDTQHLPIYQRLHCSKGFGASAASSPKVHAVCAVALCRIWMYMLLSAQSVYTNAALQHLLCARLCDLTM